MSPNVKASMRQWITTTDIPLWALKKAAEITEQTVPQVDIDSRNMLYEMPSGLKLRLTMEIAQALVSVRGDSDTNEVAGVAHKSGTATIQCVHCQLWFPRDKVDGLDGKLRCVECDQLEGEEGG